MPVAVADPELALVQTQSQADEHELPPGTTMPIFEWSGNRPGSADTDDDRDLFSTFLHISGNKDVKVSHRRNLTGRGEPPVGISGEDRDEEDAKIK